MKKPSIRKGCNSCGNELYSFKEKFTRTCDKCAREAAKAFELMAQGKFKEGKDKFLETAGLKTIDKEAVEKKIDKVTNNKKLMRNVEKKAIKEGRKRGLSPEQIIEGMKNVK